MSNDIQNVLCDNKIPIVYSNYYNISFGGLERLHPFDSTKWKKVMTSLFVKSQNSVLKASVCNNSDLNGENSLPEPKKRKSNSIGEETESRTESHPNTAEIQNDFKNKVIVTGDISLLDNIEQDNSTPDKTEEDISSPGKPKDKQKRLIEDDSSPNEMDKTKKIHLATESEIIKPIIITNENIYEPDEATIEDLRIGHTDAYIKQLKSSYQVAKIVEVPIVALTPMLVTNRMLLKKFRYHVGGTILAAKLALHYQWAINVGGGFHHASEQSGGGFCVYADISIAIKKLMKSFTDFKFMIIDLDAHQGNGHETDFQNEKKVFIFDMFNEGIYPQDEKAKVGIDLAVGLMSYTKNEKYLELLKKNLETCFQSFSPNLIIYNAGTDCLLGDPLGRLSIDRQGIIDRDEMVFRKAKEMKCPIAMVTSGGYQMSNAEIIADSIWNLFVKGIIS